ncbi:glycosyltransferase [Rhizobium sp. TRM95111]|uniref:glycosyltransferase family 2 protein n=1 Tax=Rhizobium alarense TaxID=2846851 RepID=UPI001F4241B2|nr:glycosyltransferase family 2 protein [Rhizobium alarense]MCF3640368.1 glycosyltransferase [Rhizobium alarense]
MPFSVIVPCFNVETVVPETIASLKLQNVEDAEYILIDDASTDGTLDIVTRLTAGDSRFRVLQNEKNIGLGATRNRGFAESRGDYIAYLDSDDYVGEGYYSALIQQAKEFEAPFVRSGHIEFNGPLRKLGKPPESVCNIPISALISGFVPVDKTAMVDYPFAWAGVFDAKFLRDRKIGYADHLHTAEDRLTVIRMHAEADFYVCSSVNNIYYRREPRPTLRSVGDMRQLDIFGAIRDCVRYAHDARLPDNCVRKIYIMAVSLVDFHLRNRQRLERAVNRRLDTLTGEIWTDFDPGLLADVVERNVRFLRHLRLRRYLPKSARKF